MSYRSVFRLGPLAGQVALVTGAAFEGFHLAKKPKVLG